MNLCQIWSKLMCKKDRVPHRSCENKQLDNYPVCNDLLCSPNMSIINKPFSSVFKLVVLLSLRTRFRVEPRREPLLEGKNRTDGRDSYLGVYM